MNKLEIGMYVRTKRGFIDKIININEFREPNMKYALEQPSWNDDILFIGEDKIYKASFNIIDLIEEGDYVNGEKIDSLLEDKKLLTEAITNAGIDGRIINSSDIKSIVTKEQFESMEYKLGDNNE